MATPRLSTDDLCLLTNNLSVLINFLPSIINRTGFMGEVS